MKLVFFVSLLLNIVIGLAVTFVIDYLPILLFRRVIYKRPLSYTTGKIVAILYQIALFAILVLIGSAIGVEVKFGFGIVMWGIIIYHELTSGYYDYLISQKQQIADSSNLKEQEVNEDSN